MRSLPPLTYLLFISCLLTTVTTVRAAEWQTLKDGSHRIEAEQENTPEPEKPVTVPLPEGHYEPGQGDIDGAFGLLFGETLKDAHIARPLDWITPTELPDGLEYQGLVKPLKIEQILVEPPLQPALLKQQNVSYRALVDFDRVPMRITTSAFSNPAPIIEIIQRKYGEPDEVDGHRTTYIRGDHKLHILSKHADSASLVYEDLAAFRAYLTERNRSLKRKFRNREFDRLSPDEQDIVDLARQLETFRQGDGQAFGLAFGRRVGFKAAPDEFVEFAAPKPMKALPDGDYMIMVSPDLMPIAIRFQKTGSEAVLTDTKQRIELAMELAFAGFLKQTPHHTVLSFNQHAYSLLIRNGVFNFTIHDRTENNARNDRVKAAKVAAAEARKEQERLAELERQRQEIAARQKEIAEEKAF
ncbi:MAG: hypothetical protein ACE37D_16410 [Pseudomonadales bacterium]